MAISFTACTPLRLAHIEPERLEIVGFEAFFCMMEDGFVREQPHRIPVRWHPDNRRYEETSQELRRRMFS